MKLRYYILFFILSVNYSFSFAQSNYYETIIFNNYDQKEYKVRDFKNKAISLSCLSIYAKKADSIVYFMMKTLENHVNHIKKENKDNIFIIVLYDEIEHTLSENREESFRKYERICENLKKQGLTSKQVFFMFEMGIYRNFTQDSIFNGMTVPMFQTFYINNEGKSCTYQIRSIKTPPCYTQTMENKLKTLHNRVHKIFDIVDFDRFFIKK